MMVNRWLELYRWHRAATETIYRLSGPPTPAYISGPEAEMWAKVAQFIAELDKRAPLDWITKVGKALDWTRIALLTAIDVTEAAEQATQGVLQERGWTR